MHSLSFRYLFPNYGGITQLFIDYVYNFRNVSKYYSHDFNDFENLPGLIETVLKNYKNREKIVDILKKQNFSFGNKYAEGNLDILSKDNTLAVVTGQQVGLFSGPIYTIYKIITAIKLAYFLSERFPDFNFVPVFYLESEDHDFFESNNAKIFNSRNELVKVDFNPDDEAKGNYGPVGEIKFNEKIEDVVKKLEDELQDTEFKSDVLKLLRLSYKQDVNFTEAFAKFVGELFKNFGLIFLNPNEAEFKKLLVPIFEKEIEEHPRLSGLIVDVSAELEGKYHVQVKPRPLNLFLLYKGGRFPIEPAEEGVFRLKGVRFKLSKGELKNILETNPELLSPNVVLRPICQDTLLPTIFYIAGPSEIAYFAQLKPAYVYFNVPMPGIFPRISATLIEPKIEKILKRYNVDVREVFADFSMVAKKILLSNSEVDIDGFFNIARSRMESLLNEVREFVSKIDTTLVGAVDNSSSKIFYHINNIYEKTISAHQKKNEVIAQQIDKLKINLFPEGEIQERVLNITYFLNKYGLDLIDRLFDEFEAFDFNHQLVYL